MLTLGRIFIRQTLKSSPTSCLICNTVDIFVFISTMHLLFLAKQKYRTTELSYCYDHNVQTLLIDVLMVSIGAEYEISPYIEDKLYSYFRPSRSHDFAHDMTMLNTICLTHSIWKTSIITINVKQRHHFCFPANMIWHTGRCYHCVQNIFHLL